jgi:hypothetical protein
MTTLIPKFQQTGTGAVNRPINQKLSEIVSVKDFGATGDGTTDDTAAIQACINATTLGTIYFPQGTYKITSSLTLAGGAQNLQGEGQRTIINLSGFVSGQAAIINHGSSGSPRSNQSIQGLQIFSDNGLGYGLSLEFIVRGIFKDLWFYSLQKMVSVTDQCYICLFESLRGYGITNKCFHVNNASAFNNNTFINCGFGGTGVLIDSPASEGIAFVGCDFEGCAYDAIYPAAIYFKTASSLELTGISGISFNGCYWENNNCNAIYLDAQNISVSSYDGISGVNISGCYFTGGYNDVGHTNAAYVLVAFNAHGISVTGNYFSDFKTAVVFEGGGNGPWLFESNSIGKNSLGVERIPAFSTAGRVLGGPGGYVKNNGQLTRREFQGTAIPISGTYIVGDIVWNNTPSAASYEKWICVVAGTPGTWKGASLIQA